MCAIIRTRPNGVANFVTELSIFGREHEIRSDMMNISQLKALQQFYCDELQRHATFHTPSNFQLSLQDFLFAQHQRVTDLLDKLL